MNRHPILFSVISALSLLFGFSSCVQMQVGDNIRSTGNPQEVYTLRIDSKQPVYCKDARYYLEAKQSVRYHYPSCFESSMGFGAKSSYDRYIDSGSSDWLEITLHQKERDKFVKVKPCTAPDLASCRLIPHSELPQELQGFADLVNIGPPENAPVTSTGQSLAALPFDYLIDPVGTVLANTVIVAVGIPVALVALPIGAIQNASDKQF